MKTDLERIGEWLALVLHITAAVKRHDYYLGITTDTTDNVPGR